MFINFTRESTVFMDILVSLHNFLSVEVTFKLWTEPRRDTINHLRFNNN